MTKLKFLKLYTTMPWEAVCEVILNAKYSEAEQRGFIAGDIDRKEISATFYEKIIYSEIINDPIRGSQEVIRETFLATQFRIYNNNIICVLNPSRRLSSFLTFLSIKTKNLLATQEIIIDIDNFFKMANQKFDIFSITKATYKQFDVSDTLKCSMALTSQQNVFEQLNQINFPLPHTPAKISFDGLLKGQRMKGDVSQTGLFTLLSDNLEELLAFLLDSKDILFIEK